MTPGKLIRAGLLILLLGLVPALWQALPITRDIARYKAKTRAQSTLQAPPPRGD